MDDIARGTLCLVAYPLKPMKGRFHDIHTDKRGLHWMRFRRVRPAPAHIAPDQQEAGPGFWTIPLTKADDWVRPADEWTLTLLGYSPLEIKKLLRRRPPRETNRAREKPSKTSDPRP